MHGGENILFLDEDFGNVLFNCKGMGILNIDLNNINLANNFDEDILILLFLSGFWLGILNSKNAKSLKKDK